MVFKVKHLEFEGVYGIWSFILRSSTWLYMRTLGSGEISTGDMPSKNHSMKMVMETLPGITLPRVCVTLVTLIFTE